MASRVYSAGAAGQDQGEALLLADLLDDLEELRTQGRLQPALVDLELTLELLDLVVDPVLQLGELHLLLEQSLVREHVLLPLELLLEIPEAIRQRLDLRLRFPLLAGELLPGGLSLLGGVQGLVHVDHPDLDGLVLCARGPPQQGDQGKEQENPVHTRHCSVSPWTGASWRLERGAADRELEDRTVLHLQLVDGKSHEGLEGTEGRKPLGAEARTIAPLPDVENALVLGEGVPQVEEHDAHQAQGLRDREAVLDAGREELASADDIGLLEVVEVVVVLVEEAVALAIAVALPLMNSVLVVETDGVERYPLPRRVADGPSDRREARLRCRRIRCRLRIARRGPTERALKPRSW